MDHTAIQAGVPKTSPGPHLGSTGQSSLRTQEKSWLLRYLEVLASLRLTVILFILSFILVFFGTWAQKDAGIWTVVNEYFRSAFVWIPMRTITMYAIYTMEGDKVHYIEGAIPYPGGWLLGGLLLANLLAAHAIRFKASWKRSGILLIHSGLILMMLGEVITGVYAIESRMPIVEGDTTNFAENSRLTELAIVDRSDPKADREVLIPGEFLEKGGVIKDEKLPFDIEVVRYMKNSDVHTFRPGKDENPANVGIGLTKVAVEKPETAGVGEQRVELPAAYLTFKEKGTNNVLGTYLVSTYFSFLQRPMEEVKAHGKKYSIALRFQRSYRDFYLHLLEFRHDKYVGTQTPKNYSSRVRLFDPTNKEDREVTISMNNPLRYRGETFYQAELHPLAKGTVLQVVRNPGWLLPYLSCLVVTLGMMVHFGLHLREFLRKRFAA
jgi:hypothetical protein